mmetsp:Transcript_26241/g.40903  ORF Transcript_26241/g.40903 Transcript_26241/m.40903 type:complete len:205 (-) Transcript_26241:128-742(-)
MVSSRRLLAFLALFLVSLQLVKGQDCSLGECPFSVTNGAYVCTKTVYTDCCIKAISTFRALINTAVANYPDPPYFPNVTRDNVTIVTSDIDALTFNPAIVYPKCRPGFFLTPFGISQTDPTTRLCYSRQANEYHVGFNDFADCLVKAVMITDIGDYLENGLDQNTTDTPNFEEREWPNHLPHCQSSMNIAISSCLNNFILEANR